MRLKTQALFTLAVGLVLAACGGQHTGSAPAGNSASSKGIPQLLCGVTWAGGSPEVPVAFNVARPEAGETLHIPAGTSATYLVVSQSCKVGVRLAFSRSILSYRTVIPGRDGGAVMIVVATHGSGRETLRAQPVRSKTPSYTLAIVVGHGLAVRISHG